MNFDFTKEPGRELLHRGLSHDGAPLVSIITPFYNAGKYFEQTFNCVMNQTFPWFEWIIVNDGSTRPEDVRLLESFAEKDDRITVIHKENGGISTGRNAAIRASSTDIIIPLDADDLIAPTYVEVLYWALRKNPDCSWSYSCNVGFQNQEYLWDKPFDPELLKTYNYLVYSGAIRKSAIEQVHGYDEITKHYFEDWHMWLRLLAAHHKPVKVKSYSFWYRRLDTGVLSIVNRDPQVREFAQKLIQDAASGVDTSIKAKEYPCRSDKDHFSAPKRSDFDRKVFARHDKIHVMMLLPWMEMGGADLFNLDICRNIDKSRFEISVLTTVPGEQSWRQRFEDCVTDIFDLPSFLDAADYPEFISYFIRSRETDVLFLSNSYDGYYLLPWLRKEFPHLAIIDYVHMEEWYWREGGYARTSGVMGSILEKTYVCNEQTRQVLLSHFQRAPESVETLYIGVDKDRYDASAVEGGHVRKELGIAEDRPIVLFPCRIHPQKRPFLMVEIAKAVRKSIPDIAFVVVGDGPQSEELIAAVKNGGLTGAVYFAGRRNDLRPFYKDCAMTLICSLKEGLALTAYESLSMGRPVISSDVGGQAELIDTSVGRILPLWQDEAAELDSRNYSAEEIEQYADAITELLGDPERCAQMCLACRRRIETGFSSQIMIRKLEGIFENLVRDPEAAKARAALAAGLEPFDRLTGDSYALYHLYEAQQHEMLEVWQGKLWVETQYREKCAEAETLHAEHAKLQAETDALHAERTKLQTEYTSLRNGLPDATLSLYQNGGIGFRYIFRYIAAWFRFKLFGKKR